MIQILGVEGHHRTTQLTENVQKAIKDLNLNIPLQKAGDLDTLINYKISCIPAMAINEQVVIQQEIPSVEDLKILLSTLEKKPHLSIRL